jgi:hypothetical protein
LPDISEAKVQITLTIGELRDLVAMTNLAAQDLAEEETPEIVGDVSGLYFELMENIKDGYFGEFEPQ